MIIVLYAFVGLAIVCDDWFVDSLEHLRYVQSRDARARRTDDIALRRVRLVVALKSNSHLQRGNEALGRRRWSHLHGSRLIGT